MDLFAFDGALMSTEIDIRVVCTPAKGETYSKQMNTKFGLKEHLESCEVKLKSGELVKINILPNRPDSFPVGEVTADNFSMLWLHLQNTEFFLSDKERNVKVNASKSELCVKLIIGDMRGRAGLGDVWDSIDEGVKNEIRQEWQRLLGRVL